MVEMALDDNSDILQSDAANLLQRIAENTEGRQLSFDFVQNNVDRVLSSRCV